MTVTTKPPNSLQNLIFADLKVKNTHKMFGGCFYRNVDIILSLGIWGGWNFRICWPTDWTDLDGDGKVSEEELIKAMEAVGITPENATVGKEQTITI